MRRHFLEPGLALLDHRFPLALDAPFTRRTAHEAKVSRDDLGHLVRLGLLRRVLQGVYVAAQVPDSLELRAAALGLIVPEQAVVTDRSAAWLYGAPTILPAGSHLVVPQVSVFRRTPGCRLRNDLAASGQRTMPDDDVADVDGLAVTTPLRTACDLGRQRSRDASFACLSMMLATGLVTKAEVVDASAGLRGQRWVRQLRAMAPLADHRLQSYYEAVTMLRWLDCTHLPRPEPQRPVPAPASTVSGLYYVDLGVDELRFGVEYDGEEFHGEEQRPHDEERRRWITEHEHWVLPVVRGENLYEPKRNVEVILRTEHAKARGRMKDRRWIA